MSRYPLVLLDLDGTLVDSFGDIVAGIRIACEAIGVEPTAELCRLATRGVPLEDFFVVATGVAHDADHERYARFVDAYRAHYLPGCVMTTVPFPGVVDTLRALRERASRPVIGVATTKRTETAARVLEGTGLRELIDVFSGSDGLRHKPDPAVLRKVAALAGLDIERAVMIGDTDRDVGAARAAGCAAIGVTYGGFADDEMRVLEPDHVVGTFPEILALL